VVLFDTCFLLHVISDSVRETDPKTRALIDKLLLKLQQLGERIVVPTPALSEVLVGSGKARSAHLQILKKASKFKIMPFDEIAAVRGAEWLAKDLGFDTSKPGKKKGKRGGAKGDWPKVKVDRQIVIVAQIENVHTIYTNDADVEVLSRALGITVITPRNLDTHLRPAPIFDQHTPAIGTIKPPGQEKTDEQENQPETIEVRGSNSGLTESETPRETMAEKRPEEAKPAKEGGLSRGTDTGI
jgi:hypothetical protein